MLDLYHHGSSVCAAKVRFALAEKGLEWTGHYLDILRGDQFTPDYLALNPKGVVPTLVHDGAIITESTVICQYADELKPDPPLMPKDLYARAQVRLWLKAVDEDLHPACGAVTFMVSHRHTVAKLGPADLEKFLNSTPQQSVTTDWKSQKRQFVKQGLKAPGGVEKIKLYDAYLHKADSALRTSAWLAGDQFTLADVSLAPYVNRMAAMSLAEMWEGGRLPGVERWFEAVRSRPTWHGAFEQWVPDSLRADLAENGRKSLSEIKEILSIAHAAPAGVAA